VSTFNSVSYVRQTNFHCYKNFIKLSVSIVQGLINIRQGIATDSGITMH